MENRATLANLINHPNPNNAVLAQKGKLIKQIRGKENQQQRGLPPDFIDKIDYLVKSFASTNGSSIVLQKSLWQADPAIAKRAINGDVDAILSGDSDFAMYVGGGGPDGCGDIMLRNPTLGKRNTHLESLQIWTGQKNVVNYINEILKPKVRQSIFQKDPQHPIFDGLDQIRFRALFALALGCDALPGGIDGFGAKKASIIRSKIDFSADPAVAKEELLKHLVAASLISKPKIYRHVPAGLTREDFICLSDSLIYEPTHSGYLTGHKPAALEKYNIDFAEEGAGVACRSNGAASETCKGCFSYGHHAFLKAEGAHQCNFCKHPVCRSCLWDPSLRNKNANRSQLVCLPCKVESFLGVDEVTERDMRQFLSEHHVYCPANAKYEAVLDLYHRHNSGDDDLFSEAINKVQYPLLPSSALHSSKLFQPDGKIHPITDDIELILPNSSLVIFKAILA
ncbi:unnamed protein product [Cylindrotheca closterium]|uniref:Uncharacterized protein n=1 Tax=Cylindrotheca closterium TaxID=2856 RepID=A0AAD2FSR8_9STRA|nr:unnamed protein product [Cylindrotheca closterium]